MTIKDSIGSGESMVKGVRQCNNGQRVHKTGLGGATAKEVKGKGKIAPAWPSGIDGGSGLKAN